MKKNIISMSTLLMGLIVAIIVFFWFEKSISESTIIDFLIYTVLIPCIICFGAICFVGIINKKYNVAAWYAAIYGVIMCVTTNILVVSSVDNKMIDVMVSNTKVSDSVMITTSSAGFSIGNVVTSILMYVVIGAVGGMIGVKIAKLFKK